MKSTENPPTLVLHTDETPKTDGPASSAADVPSPRRDVLPVALLKAMRLKQATKNLFVFAALVFANRLTVWTDLQKVILAFLLFTLASGSVYILNDLLDVEQDRMHPKKRFRPIASGALPVSVARFATAGIASLALLGAFSLSPGFGIVVTAYLVLQIAYCLRLKHMVLLDVFAIAAGFVLRTVGGGMVIHVHLSQWLLLCTLLLALFLGFGKRRQELITLGEKAGKHRAILGEYSLPFLDQAITIVVGVTIVCYSVYCVESPSAQKHPHLWMTVPFVLYGVCRYLYLVYQKGWGGAPDEVLLEDRALQIAIGLWFVTILLLFQYDVPGRSLLGLN